MFGFLKKKPVPPPSDPAPEPIAGRKGHVGGIESLNLDGTTWFFGFDYCADLAVSPLISDIDQMARYASVHMLQTDGEQEPAYWRDLAETSIDDSLLSSASGSRNFSIAGLAAIVDALDRAAQADACVPGFAIPHHLQYLLGAAGGWTVETADFESAIAIVSGEEQPGADARIADVALWLRGQLRALTEAAPGNWRTLFMALAA
jgi:hypothetical protein